MPDRSLRYDIGATDTASAVFAKVERSSAKAHKSMQGDFDESASKVKQFTQVFGQLGDEVQSEILLTEGAVEKLKSALGDELSFTAREAFETLQRGGLSAQDILAADQAEVDELADKLRHLDSVAQQAGGGVRDSFDGATTGVRNLGTESDNSRSVMANMVGNATQDLGELGGVAGTAGVAIGQLGEYATEGNISLAGLAKVAGPMAILAVGVGVVTSRIAAFNEKKEEAARRTKDFIDALRSENPVLEANQTALEELTNVLDEEVESALREAGASYLPFVEAVSGGSEALDHFADYSLTTAEQNMRALMEAVEEGSYANDEFAQGLARMVESGELTAAQAGEIGRAVADIAPTYERAQTEAENLDHATDSMGDAIGEVAGTTEEATEGTEAYTAATEAHTAATEANTEKLLERRAAVGDLLGQELSMAEAMLATAAEIDAYNAVMADGEATTSDRTQAGIDLLQQFLSEADTAREAAEVQATAAGRADSATREGVDAQIDSLLRLAQNLEPGSYLRQQIDGHIWALASIPRTIDTTVRLNGTYTQGTAGILVGEDARPRAGGGPVEAGRTYRGGERGLETFTDAAGHTYFIPGDSGQVTPNHNLGTDTGSAPLMTDAELKRQTNVLRELVELVRLGSRRPPVHGAGGWS